MRDPEYSQRVCYHHKVASAAKVRVRFAPSPTGQLHVGNARTALFNWLFARQKGGTMVLRIEDTDVERSEARFETQLLDDLKWLGLDWDEGPDAGGSFAPYRQSDRVAIYREHAERLLREGKAYLCFCTPEELEQERQRAQAEHRSPIYSGKCRKLDPAEAERRRAAGEPAAIRLHIPEHPLRFHDMVHGAVEFPNEVISDPIILRSNGMPVYNFVVVIDDALMKITHVIRGDDHLSNTPKQVALYEALGWPTPEFAHLSTILGSDRERLSKRHGATSVANFREMGVLPEALVNYLALLGWAPSGGDREIFSREELIREFSLDRVTPSPAVFDMEKLYWLNRHYIKQRFGIEASAVVDVGTASPERLQVLTGLSSTELAKIRHLGDLVAKSPTAYSALLAGRFFEKAGFGDLETFIKDVRTERWFLDLVRLLAPSVNQLSELPSRAWLIFSYDSDSALQDPSNAQVLQNPKTAAVIQAFAKHMGKQKRVTPEDFKAVMTQVKTETGAKGQELFHPVRIMLTGSHSGPEFDKLIPIIEEGSQLNLPKHVKSVWERVEEFTKSRNASSA